MPEELAHPWQGTYRPEAGDCLGEGSAGQAVALAVIDLDLPAPVAHRGLGQVEVLGDLTN
ncbi:hypothetical protein ACFZDK_16540 [Streptomyces sp. NPDC007901]|uniref:hypothetical protein n=1 Tax=Streptomyces sp. NPDC007901 TaxID=3364785 RepID=UPI0036E9243B